MAARPHNRRFCSHCNCKVSKSTWYNHLTLREAGSSNSKQLCEEEITFTDSSESDHSMEMESNLLESDNELDCANPLEEGCQIADVNDDSSGPELWSDDDLDSDEEVSSHVPSETNSMIRVFTLFILSWQSMYRIANVAVSGLFKFMTVMFGYLATVTRSEHLQHVAKWFPDNIIKAQQLLHLNRDDFIQYACCPICFAVYDVKECVETIGSHRKPISCTACRFPRHPWPSHRGKCGSSLVKSIQTSRKQVFRPIKSYCYRSVITSLTDLLSRPGIMDACEQWRTRPMVPGLLSDIFDGRMWKKFENDGFFSQPHSYGLILNIDWFEPFEHSVYAVGVIFMALLNLPRDIRYNQENMIICGLIPGPHEPSLNVNALLEPLVDDLLKLWRGKDIPLPTGTTHIKAVLLCISCDSPAMRKVAGFLSHSATKGCFKCNKSFPTSSFGDKPDYGGFDRENWKARTHTQCYQEGMKHKHAKTATARSKIEKDHGVRYTILLTLPYYDSVRFCVVDPMHNLLLGSAKTFTKVWKEQQKPDLASMQTLVDKFVLPAGMGRIPRKIESGFSNFKAEQWKNWVIVYSIVCFKDVLSGTQYSMWVLFVQVCMLFCSHMISEECLQLADRLIHEYCCMFEQEFGRDKCYPNLHLGCHLKECLLDFGPATAFWLFPFERLNGCLGSFHTNNQAVEVQLFRKFLCKQKICNSKWPDDELSAMIKPLLNSTDSNSGTNSKGLYLHILNPYDPQAIAIANNSCKLLPAIKRKALCSDDLKNVQAVCSTLFGERFSSTLIMHKVSKSVFFNGELYGSCFSRQKNSSLIIAHLGGIRCPCFVAGFAQITLVFNRDTDQIAENYVFAKVFPLQEHGQIHFFPEPVEIWKKPHEDEIQDSSKHQYIHVSSIVCRCAYSPFHNAGSSTDGIIVIPCNKYYGLTKPS